MSRAVIEVFVRLHEQGLIYRGKRSSTGIRCSARPYRTSKWTREEEGKIWEIRYPLEDASGSVVVVTTRPETMLGDVAVAVNRGTALHEARRQARATALTGRTIPVIADDYVDPEFGTGCVKITPAHDFNDYAVGQRHKLPQISVMTLEARMNETRRTLIVAWTVRGAQAIVADLKSQNLLVSEKPYKLRVPRSAAPM